MDCEKFEAHLMDELYEELDELTSAAARRHIAGCARCASLIGGLRATRRVAVLPWVEPSVDLEDRILAAARDAQKVVPFSRKLSRAISLAGSWAMRPQSAMAAVMVIFVAVSLVFVRRGKMAPDGTLTVTAEGEPSPVAAAVPPSEAKDSLDSKVAASAHGAPAPAYAAAPPPPAASAAPAPYATSAPTPGGPAAFGDNALALNMKEKGGATSGLASNRGYGPDDVRSLGRAAPAPKAAYRQPPADEATVPSDLDKADRAGEANASAVAGAPAQTTPQGQADQRRAATGGDAPSGLQAANTTRDTQGCASAVGVYDRVAQLAWGTKDGYEAKYAAGLCYKQLGNTEAAQQRFSDLLAVPSYIDQAKAQIASITSSQQQIAARKKAAPAKPMPKAVVLDGQQAAPPQQQAPAAPPATPPAAAPARQTQAF